MTVPLTVAKTFSIGGKTFTEQKQVAPDAAIIRERSVPAAQTGVLSVRTSDTVGTITMDSGSHTVSTGDRIDLYWSGGSRRGVTVGTVAGTSVPISAGAGDILPAATTAVTVAIASSVPVDVNGTNAQAIVFSTGGAKGTLVLTDSGDVEKYARVIEANGADIWYLNNGDVNPITGQTIAKAYLTHDDAVNAQTMKLAVSYN